MNLKNIFFATLFIWAAGLQAQKLNTFDRFINFSISGYPDSNQVTYGDNDYNSFIQLRHDSSYVFCRSVIDTFFKTSLIEMFNIDRQGRVLWRRQALRSQKPTAKYFGGSSVCEVNQTGLMYATTVSSAGHGPQITLIRADYYGLGLWLSKQYPGDGESTVNCIKETKDHGFIIGGSTLNPATNIRSAFLIKTDSAGNQIWANKFRQATDSFAVFNEVAEIPGKGYAAVGYSDMASHSGIYFVQNSGIVVQTDLNGNAQWSRKYFESGGYGGYVSSVISASDKSIVITGQHLETVSPYTRLVFIAKLDSTGTVVWMNDVPGSANNYDSYGCSIKEKNGFYVLSGYLSDPIPAQYIAKITSAGALVWCNTSGHTFHPFNYQSATFIPTADGGYAYQTMTGSTFGVFGTTILKTDSLGKTSCDGLPFPFVLQPLSVVSNESLTSSSSQSTDSVQLYLGYTVGADDSVLCESIQDYASALGIHDLRVQPDVLLQNQPNPASEKTTIRYTIQQPATRVIVHVNDLRGINLFEKVQWNAAPGEYALELNTSVLPAGIYFYSLTVDGRMQTKKMVVR